MRVIVLVDDVWLWEYNSKQLNNQPKLKADSQKNKEKSGENVVNHRNLI